MSFETVIALGIWTLVPFLAYWLRHGDSLSTRIAQERKIRQLEQALEYQRQYYERRIKELEKSQEDASRRYEEEIAQLRERIDFLLEQFWNPSRLHRDLPDDGDDYPHSLPAKPLVLICGPVAAFCEKDRRSLKRAQISFHRIVMATRDKIAAYMRGQRQNGTVPTWVHVTAHAEDAGIDLADGIAPPEWWAEMLDGVEVVMLAACKTSTVADALAGLTTVVFTYDDIRDQDAADFTYAFWRRMRLYRDPQRAFNEAREEVPQVADSTHIRFS